MSSLNLILYKNVLIIFLITKTINEISLKSTVHCLTINNISKIYTNNNNNSNSNDTNNENNNISNNNKNLNLNHNKNTISSSKQIDDREKLHPNVGQDQTKGSLSKEIVDQLTTNNPCLVHYCSKGRECILDNVSGQPTCICQRYCSHRKRPICGSDGKIYENHCELHRSSCLYDRQITYQRFDKCSKPKQSKKAGLNAPKIDRSLTEGTSNVRGDDNLKEYHDFTGAAVVVVVTESTNNFEMAVAEELVGNIDYKAIATATQSTMAIANDGGLGPPLPAAITLHDTDMDDAHGILAQTTSNRSADIDSMLNDHILPTSDSLPQATTYPPSGQIVRPNFAISGQINETGQHPIDLLSNGASVNDIISSFNQNDYCSSQEYEIMKDNLLLYSHARLMSQDNKHSKDFLVSIMFSHYDQNNNGHLEIDELNQISINEHLNELSNGCILDDMINFDDTDHDGKLSINEFYQAFSKLYSVSVVSLDKALETNHLSARVGDNVEIKCDVTGTPLPPIIWVRNNVDLSLINENDVRVFNDGSLYLTRIQLQHSGNYTCHAQRNKDVVQTHMLSVYTIPEVRVMPRIQSKRPGENAEMFCHVTGDPFPKVEWLKNDDRINLNIPDKYNIIGNGTSLKIHNIAYSDTGAYMCQATNIGGSVRDISSLIVQEEPTPTVINEEHKFFVFYEYGVAVYEPSACRLHHQIQGTDIIPGTQEYVCGEKGVPCSWGNALNVGTRYIYVSQPIRDRVLVISTIQMVVVDVISTDKYPVELFYVPRYDQVWILNWRYSNNIDAKTIQVIRDAGQKRKHHTVHPEPIDGQFDLVKSMFIPSADIEQPHYSYKYGYVTHKNQRGLYKLDLANLRYTKSVDLTLYNCVPEHIKFSALYGFVIISCREPITNRPHGQIVLDYLTDAVLTTKLNLNGIPRISPDSRHLATIEHNSNGVKIVIQKIAQNGLEFLFDVKTTLNISDITFFESQTMHGYDLFATASDKEDILYLNLYTGKVEMITGVGPAMSNSLIKWGNPTRLIRSSGLFGQYMVTPASNALFIINGKARTVNCEIGGVLHPIAIVWTHNINSYMTNSFTESSILRP